MPKQVQEQTVLEAPTLVETPEPEQKLTDDRLVNIPLEDITVRVKEINQPAIVAAREAASEQHRVPQPRMAAAFQGPTGFHDLPLSIAQEIYDAAESDNRGFDITRALYATREETAVRPYTPPPIPVQIAEQTRLEMEAGRKQVEKHAAQQMNRPQTRPDPGAGNMVTVFRPDDYVPDPKKGQGLVPNITMRGQNL